ncbi:LysR family transcriptional regulator [Bradyrhizobium sp. LeoA1S1]
MKTFDRNMLADLNVFLTIVRRGSLAKAGIELGVSTSALSHRLRKLESDLGVRLLHRSSRSVRPTDAGAALAADLENGFRTIRDALTGLENHRRVPVGRLRLNVLRDAARLVLGPVLPRYCKEFPGMHVDVTVEDRMVEIIAEGFDAGIRYGDRVPLDMVGIALTKPLKWVVVGSPELIARAGRPDTPGDLLQLPCVEMRVGDHRNFPWELGNGDSMIRLDVRGPVCANETEHAVDMALRGVGFVYCLERRIEAEVVSGALEILLPEWASEGPPFTIYYPSRRQPPPGLRQLIDLTRRRENLPPLATADAGA